MRKVGPMFTDFLRNNRSPSHPYVTAFRTQNIMIGRNGILKLGDLGLACRYRKNAPPLDVRLQFLTVVLSHGLGARI